MGRFKTHSEKELKKALRLERFRRATRLESEKTIAKPSPPHVVAFGSGTLKVKE